MGIVFPDLDPDPREALPEYRNNPGQQIGSQIQRDSECDSPLLHLLEFFQLQADLLILVLNLFQTANQLRAELRLPYPVLPPQENPAPQPLLQLPEHLA